MPLPPLTVRRAATISLAFAGLTLAVALVLRVADFVSWEFLKSPAAVTVLRWLDLVDLITWPVAYGIGLVWGVFLLERATQRLEAARATHQAGADDDATKWNPFDPAAAYYRTPSAWLVAALFAGLVVATALPAYRMYRIVTGGVEDFSILPDARKIQLLTPALNVMTVLGGPFVIGLFLLTAREKLRQSLTLLIVYSGLFLLVYFLAHATWGRKSERGFDLPEGGGKDSIQASAVKVQKVIRKKFVINPYSSIIFSAPPPIDQIDTSLTEETRNQYQAGQGGDGNTGDGDGDGAGFGKGTGKGKVEFVRLKHGDKGWDRNFGIGGDRDMLSEYHARTKQKVGEETVYIEASQLANMPRLSNPPLLYISGNNSLPLTPADKKNLKEYLTERHGMILGDNHGGNGFHHNFIAVMNEITGVTPVAIPRDELIHQRPYALPQLPMVVAHGPPTPLGWKIDGRWAVYYHPGALSDAWRDDHAGIRKDIYELCYQLGANVIFYSLREKNKWLQSQKP